MDPVRKLVAARMSERGLELKQVSLQLGKNPAYMQQYFKRGVPLRLPEEVRIKLGELLDLDETALGGRPKAGREPKAPRTLLMVPVRDVRASLGPGALQDEETVSGSWPLPMDYVRQALSVSTTGLTMIEVRGDSMEPTLRSGDRVLVDLHDKNVAQGGVFALHDGNATVVKRVEAVPGAAPPALVLISDNVRHNPYRVHADLVNIAGRVIWYGRRL